MTNHKNNRQISWWGKIIVAELSWIWMWEAVISNNTVLRPQNPDRITARGRTPCRLLMLKQHHKLMSVPYLNLSYLPLRIHHSLLKNPRYCCSTVWGWFLRGHFMTMQPQKCCGVHRREGNRQDGSEEALKSGRAARICCSHRDRVSERALSCHYWRGTTYGNVTP